MAEVDNLFHFLGRHRRRVEMDLAHATAQGSLLRETLESCTSDMNVLLPVTHEKPLGPPTWFCGAPGPDISLRFAEAVYRENVCGSNACKARDHRHTFADGPPR
jgi:hypothetical protein